jgi:hypothetical protein
MIIALAGRRIDAADAENQSFPATNIDQVRQELHDLLEHRKPLAIVSSAACGADLLALEEAGKLGIRRRVVLPFAVAEFRKTSVTDRPGDWGAIYDQVVSEVSAASDLLIVSPDARGDEAYSLANRVILDQAWDLAKFFDRPVTAVLVWDGQGRGAGDLTESFRTEASGRGFEIVEIRTTSKSLPAGHVGGI